MSTTTMTLELLLPILGWIAFLISLLIAKKQWDDFKKLEEEVAAVDFDLMSSLLNCLVSVIVATGLFVFAAGTSYAYYCSLDPGMIGRPDHIIGFVYQDNAPPNGQWDAGEPLLANAEVYLVDQGGTQDPSFTTGPNGFYRLDAPSEDSYTLGTGGTAGTMGVPGMPGPYYLYQNTGERLMIDIGVP